ncbi:GerW family sporulation protein [uncultured Clostridium sp.]|uniref:GerW family sporulation protein n=1 Tax=uncultured Clostridium sp. TaxID=59620 RepID=UPI00262B91EB|nr:GerW family sporulation protein [uncultured Clostridium sp.]
MEFKHPIENLMKSTMENLKDMIDVNTVIGDGIETPDGSFILPISKVSFGFASGGSEFPKDKNSLTPDGRFPFGGGSGSGVTVKPVAFLIIKGDNVKLLPVDQNNTYDRIVDKIPQLIDTLKDFLCKNKDKCKDKETVCCDDLK